MSSAEGSGRKRSWRIVLIDDHPLVRAGLAALIGNEPDLEVCGETGLYREAFELVERTRPDLAIIDLSLADGSGLELVKRLTSRSPGVRLLVCSMHDELLLAKRVLNAGAMGYISKHQATAFVVTAIRKVLDGKLYLSDAMTERVLCDYAAPGRQDDVPPSISRLTDRELEVFSLIGHGLRPSQIAEQLSLSVKTIESHREKIKKKLNLANGNELTRLAIHWTLDSA